MKAVSRRFFAVATGALTGVVSPAMTDKQLCKGKLDTLTRFVGCVGGAMLYLAVTGVAQGAIVADNSITGSITNTFEGIGTGTRNSLVNQTGAQYGERFDGQFFFTGGFDTLSGTPSGPLTLLPGAAAQNLELVSEPFGGSITIAGCSIANCPNVNAIGEGALSVFLSSDTDVFGFDVAGSDGGVGRFQFFSRSGNILGDITIASLSDSFFGFRTTAGERIAGVSLTNMDLGGIGFDNVTFNQLSPVPIPAALPLFLSGLIALGLAGYRRRKAQAA